MRKFGSSLLFFGIGSIILNLIHVQFILLIWIDFWGPTVGWAIRGGMIALGAILWLLGSRDES